MENYLKTTATVFEEKSEIRRYIDIFFAKRWLIAVIIAVIMTTDIIFTFGMVPVYRATALVLIEQPAASVPSQKTLAEEINPLIGGLDYYNTQFEILKSKSLLRKVAKELNLKSLKDFSELDEPGDALGKMVTVEPIKGTRLVEVSVDYKDPAMATKMANTLVDFYMEQNMEHLVFMSKEVLKFLPETKGDAGIYSLYGKLNEMSEMPDTETIESLPTIVNNPVLQKLKAEKITAETERAFLSKKYKENHPEIQSFTRRINYLNNKIDTKTRKVLESLKADLAGRLQANNVRVVDYADVPKKPIKPKKGLNIVGGLFFSIFLSAGLVLILDYFDDTIKGEEDLRIYKIELPFLGSFPYLKPDIFSKDIYNVLSEIDKDHDANNAIRNIRTNIEFSMPHEALKTILFTSVVPQEGKSFLATFLSYSFAKNNIKTLLIECDMRKPTIHRYFNIDKSPGITNILIENATVENVIQKTKYENLYILSCGSDTPNPVELLDSPKMKSLITEVSKKFDKVLIDSPPSFVLPDSLVLSKISNATVFVSKSGFISAGVLQKEKAKFESVNAKIIGIVINHVKEHDTYYKYKYYHKYYRNYHPEAET